MAGNPPTLPMTQGYDAPYRFLVNRMAFVALGLGVFFSSFNTWRVSEQNITLSDVMFMIAAMMLIAIGRINLSPFRELTVLWFSGLALRSEEHTSELQALMRISYAVFCLKKKKHDQQHIFT